MSFIGNLAAHVGCQVYIVQSHRDVVAGYVAGVFANADAALKYAVTSTVSTGSEYVCNTSDVDHLRQAYAMGLRDNVTDDEVKLATKDLPFRVKICTLGA